MLALLTFWCQNKSGNMGAEDRGVLAPNQFTAVKCFSEVFGWLLGDIFYIEKKVYFCPMFLSGYKPAGYKRAVPPAAPQTQLSVCSIQRHSEEGAASTGPSDLCKFTRSIGGKGVLGCG